MRNTQPCDICKDGILDIEVYTRESGWFYADEDVKFCPFCGRELNENND